MTFEMAVECLSSRTDLSIFSLRAIKALRQSHSRKQSHAHLLREIQDLVVAKHGFICEVVNRVDDVVKFSMTAIHESVVAKEYTFSFSLSDSDGSRNGAHDLLFSPTLLRCEPFVCNDHAKNIFTQGLPEGYPSIVNLMALPICNKGRLYGIAFLTNKENDFESSDVDLCTALISEVTSVLGIDSLFEVDEAVSLSTLAEEEYNYWRVLNTLGFSALVLEGSVIRMVSDEVGRMFGCLPSLLVGIDLDQQPNILSLSIVSGEDYEDLESLLNFRSMSGAPSLILKLSSTLDSPRYFDLYINHHVPLRGSGIVYLIREVSGEVNAMRERRVQSQRAQEYLRLQSNITEMISHELRTPLSSLQTAVEMIEMRAGSVQQGDHFEVIYRMIEQMTSHMDSVLLVGRIADQNNEIPLLPENLVEIVADLLSVPSISSLHRIRTKNSVEDYNSCLVDVDRSMVEVVLRNVLSNALKFSSEDVHVSMEEFGSSQIRICVTDRGLGIPGDELNSIPGPFRRGSNVVNHPGTGIGLTIAAMMMKRMNASLRIESVLGEGTTVCLVFNRSSS